MATKQEMLDEIDKLTSEYLGFSTSVCGLKSKPKSEIESILHKMSRAVIYKTLADEFKSDNVLYMTITGDYSEQYIFRSYLLEIAHRLYWGESEIEAIKHAESKIAHMGE